MIPPRFAQQLRVHRQECDRAIRAALDFAGKREEDRQLLKQILFAIERSAHSIGLIQGCTWKPQPRSHRQAPRERAP